MTSTASSHAERFSDRLTPIGPRSASRGLRFELLEALSPDEQSAVLAEMRSRQLRRGDVLFHAGDPGDSMFFLSSGHLAVRSGTPSGETVTFTVLGPGQSLGEMALLRRSSERSASVVALDKATVRQLPRDAFFRLCDEQPRIERLLVGVLAARVDRLSRHLVEALYLPVEQRLIRRLLEMATLYTQRDGALDLPLTQDDIAGLAGTTRPTANAVLRELQQLGLIELRRGTVSIVDLPGLGARAL